MAASIEHVKFHTRLSRITVKEDFLYVRRYILSQAIKNEFAMKEERH